MILIGVALCFALYYLVDYVWNGSFVNWFDASYMTTTNRYLPEAQQYAIFHEPLWEKLKVLLLWLFMERLVNEFFEITRYNLQQIKLEKEQIDLYYMLVQMVDEFYLLFQIRKTSMLC